MRRSGRFDESVFHYQLINLDNMIDLSNMIRLDCLANYL